MNPKATFALRAELEDFLRQFHAGMTSAPAGPDSFADGGIPWARPGIGAFVLSAKELAKYGHLLNSAVKTIAPEGDLSVAAIDTALKDAVFAMVEQFGSPANELDRAIAKAIDSFMEFVSTPKKTHQCWIEIAGLKAASLPARYGTTSFEVLGDSHFNELSEIVINDSVGQPVKSSILSDFADKWTDSPVAIRSVVARDPAGALNVANREIGMTIECINCFADLIPFNSARLGIAHGKPGKGSSVRFSRSQDGSFYFSPHYKVQYTFDMQQFWAIGGLAGEAIGRVDVLLSNQSRSPVQELLLRSVRWVGRAIGAESSEDGLLNSMIALECLTLPIMLKCKTSATLSERAARLLGKQGLEYEKLAKDLKRHYNLRSRLVHDGSLEVSENDRAHCQSIALSAVIRAVSRSDISRVESLKELDVLFREI